MPITASSAISHARAAAAILWIDVQDPTPQEMEELARRFSWHPLSVEDAMRPHQRPKVDTYEDYQFIVAYDASYEGSRLVITELDVFLGDDYLVSVHRGPLPEIEEARRRWESHPHPERGGHSIFLLYALLDTIVDSYFPLIETISDQVSDLEQQIFGEGGAAVLRDTVALRRDMLTLSRIVGPQRDLVDRLMHSDPLQRHPELIVYFTDVHDHILRISESLTVQRELLASLQEGYLTIVSNQLNQVMKTLTVIATILMALALVAGIYGMNFRNMPELEWQYGYFMALGVMAAIAAGLIWYFRRHGWL